MFRREDTMHRSNSLRLAASAVVLALLVAGVAVAAPAAESTNKADSLAPVDLNQATLEELVEIPGIGPTMAQRILDWRDEHGPFERVDDLLKVKGIGEKSFEKLKPYVKVSKSKSR